jgi:PAS domain S-box-containing protein
VSLSPLETPNGLLVSSAIRDITARKQSERMVTESLERFRALADASPIGIAHTTPTGSVDYANKAWIDITGIEDFRNDDLVRRSIHPEDQPRSWNLLTEAATTGKPFADDMRWVRPDGTIRHTNCRAVAVRDEAGAITGYVSTVEDMTERRAAEQAAQQEREARSEVRRLREQADFKTNFLRTAAHELGTPLTPIKIQLRVLRDLVAKRPQPEEGRAVAILERNVDRLLLLVRDLLESARLQSSRLRLNPRPMDLAHLVHDVVETFQEPAIQAGIALDATVPREMAMVADPDRVTQVLYNLISNAMKFTPSGGHVHVQADDLGETVRFLVQDDGMGFTEAQGRNLFQPFSQIHDPMQTSKPGSGLGLYICKGIVEQHGGGIMAYSAGPGRGARFTVNLPRTARPPMPTPTLEADPVADKVADAPKTK